MCFWVRLMYVLCTSTVNISAQIMRYENEFNRDPDDDNDYWQPPPYFTIGASTIGVLCALSLISVCIHVCLKQRRVAKENAVYALSHQRLSIAQSLQTYPREVSYFNSGDHNYPFPHRPSFEETKPIEQEELALPRSSIGSAPPPGWIYPSSNNKNQEVHVSLQPPSYNEAVTESKNYNHTFQDSSHNGNIR